MLVSFLAESLSSCLRAKDSCPLPGYSEPKGTTPGLEEVFPGAPVPVAEGASVEEEVPGLKVQLCTEEATPERIIAMSFPSSGKQSFYRNPIKEVVRFLDTKHQNHYRVYNLCSMYMTRYFASIDRKQVTHCMVRDMTRASFISGERAYDAKYFHDRVRRYMIDDHNVPSLSEMVAFSKEVKEWMAQDEENIAVIHCKGGKGRTGTMICAYLLASEIFATAEDSLYYFGERRTDKSTSSKFQGIETPSQNRFVGYFAMVKNTYNLTLPPMKKLTIKNIVIYSIHGAPERKQRRGRYTDDELTTVLDSFLGEQHLGLPCLNLREHKKGLGETWPLGGLSQPPSCYQFLPRVKILINFKRADDACFRSVRRERGPAIAPRGRDIGQIVHLWDLKEKEGGERNGPQGHVFISLSPA
ncbi:hypothetical protein J1605_007132 [Eschrichtius robustus]|uniref:Phosphatidylinositol 3,4,5-trisphosphate 3-phosphatase TPTE2 n=1 Tax=Eschrichtius robustus TaxID=9764 RepID=A0AB34H4D8_ESCRO|nr:hypothetical protein J1605_007132 [Eschrichtius robustus]